MRTVLAMLLPLLLVTTAVALDEVEFLSGAKLQGTVKEIRKEKREFDFLVQISGRTMLRTYPYSKVHSVTINGATHVVTEKTSGDSTSGSGQPVTRSDAEVVRLIEQAGQTPPDWFDSTQLSYPQTLDLSWPLKPPTEGWQSQVNVGQYLWDVIYPNPGRWHSGIRLVHHLLDTHQNNPTLRQRDMATLGSMYFNLLQDYARAAYWLRQARVTDGKPARIVLAECYWRLGSKKMALQILSAPRCRSLPSSCLAIWARRIRRLSGRTCTARRTRTKPFCWPATPAGKPGAIHRRSSSTRR